MYASITHTHTVSFIFTFTESYYSILYDTSCSGLLFPLMENEHRTTLFFLTHNIYQNEQYHNLLDHISVEGHLHGD